MKQKALLAELELLTHDGRMSRMVAVGRSSLDQRSDAKLLAAWEEGGFYERFLSLQACYGSRDGDHVLRSLGDQSRFIRALAVRMVPTLCDNMQIVAALDATPRYLRNRLLTSLFKRHRPQIDLWLEQLAINTDESLPAVLSFGSEELVRRHAARLLVAFTPEDWVRLGRLHPALAAEILARQLADPNESEPATLARIRLVLPLITKYDPQAALSLVRDVLAHAPAADLDLDALVLRLPEEVAQLLLAQGNSSGVWIQFTDLARRLVPETVLALYQQTSYLQWSYKWFLRLKSAERETAFSVFKPVLYSEPYNVLGVEILGALPKPQREVEARRTYNSPALAAVPAVRLIYAAFLPWDELLPLVEPYGRDPDADLRGVALRSLIVATSFDRARAGELLELLLLRRNEQDPVRMGMLRALADLPPSIWQPEHLDALGGIIRQALDAKDLSLASLYAVARMLFKLAPLYPQWSGEWLATIMRERRQSYFGVFGTALPAGVVAALAEYFLPQLVVWSRAGGGAEAVAAVTSLGRRLAGLDGVLDLLEGILKRSKDRDIAANILRLLSTHSSQRFDKLVTTLLRKDESWFLLDPINEYLERRRQDLLTPFLSYRPYRGKWSRGSGNDVPFLDPLYYSWTERQQASYAKALAARVSVTAGEFSEMRQYFNAIASLPAISSTPLFDAARGEPGSARDTALQALGRLDSDAGVPVLLEALGDDRARVAIYALRRSLREMPAERALALLAAVPLEKVGVAKEVVRMVGALGGAAAYSWLLALAAGEPHRDVRVALISALSGYLDRAGTWPILDAAAMSADSPLALAAAKVRAIRLTPEVELHLISLLVALLDHPDPAVRSAVLARVGTLPLRDRDRLLLRHLLPFIAAPLEDDRSNAATAIFALAGPGDARTIAEAVAGLLPQRQALQELVHSLSHRVDDARHKEPLARAMLGVLERDPLTTNLRAYLAVEALPVLDMVAYFAAMSRAGLLHSDAMEAAKRQLGNINSRLTVQEIASLERRFAASTDALLRRLGLALLDLGGGWLGWTAERHQLLEAYRADPSPLVAGAAQFVFPPEEMEEANA